MSAVRLDVEKPGQLTYVHALLGHQIHNPIQLQFTSNLSSSSFTMYLDSCLLMVWTVLDDHIWFGLLLDPLVCRFNSFLLACYWSYGKDD